jgi:hypothetical protein
MELTAQLPALLAAFMLAAMLVLSIERFAANRKGAWRRPQVPAADATQPQ